MKSCMYMIAKKALNLNQINDTEELVKFLKDTAKKPANWYDKDTMQFRVALGARRESSPVCTKANFRREGVLLPMEELFSQEVFDQPYNIFNGKSKSNGTKSKPMEIKCFLDHLYNNESTQLFHGFVMEMKVVMKNSLMCDSQSLQKC